MIKIVFIIVKGIKVRKEKGLISNLNIIVCENVIYVSFFLKEEVFKYLNKEEVEYLEMYVGFLNCLVDRIVFFGKNENFFDVIVENFYEWNVEK